MPQDQKGGAAPGAKGTSGEVQIVHRESVRPEWIDYNGHMNVAYYVLAFDHATDALFDAVGLDEAYRKETGGSTFAVEGHITYQREVNEGDPLRIETRLLGHDDKRLHFMHQMYHDGEGYLAATAEWLSLHVNLKTRRVAPIPEEIQARLDGLLKAQGDLPLPPEAGRAITLGPKGAASGKPQGRG